MNLILRPNINFDKKIINLIMIPVFTNKPPTADLHQLVEVKSL